MILNKRIPISFLLGQAKWDFMFVTIFSVTLTAITEYYKIDYDFSIAIPAFLGTAISLILSFKLSQSYDRWWEARKIWGAIVNDSRSFVVQLKNFTGHRNNKVVEVAGLRQIAWCYSLTYRLRKQDTTLGLDKLLSHTEFERLKHHDNIPLALIDFHLADLKELHKLGEINDYQQVQIDSTCVRLTESMGQAERIKNTVFPKQYRLLLHFFIYLFIITLGFALSDLIYYFEVPLMISIAFPFLLLEKTALDLQDPFENRPHDTPMLTISRTIETNIRQLLELEDAPEIQEEEKFYAL